MTVASLRPGPAAARSAEIIERLAAARDAFPDRDALRLLVILLDRTPAAEVVQAMPPGIEALVEPQAGLEDLASRFGVTVFHEAEGVVHGSETVVIDADGIVRAIWSGTSSWSIADLLESIADGLAE